MNDFQNRFKYYSNKKSLKYGVPFLLLVLGGSFGLKEFTQLRYTFSRKTTVKPEEMEKVGVKMKTVTLEGEFEKVKKIDIDNWEMVRGPRPWEDSSKP